MKQVGISRRHFLKMGKYFRQSCIFVPVLHPLSLPTSFTTVLHVLVQAGVRFLFSAWHHFRLDGQSGLRISLSKILKYFLLQFCVEHLSSEAFMYIWQKIKMALNLTVLDCWVGLSWEWFQAGAGDVLSLWESCHHFNKRATHPLFLVLSSLPDSVSVLSSFLYQADFSSPKSFSFFLFLLLTLFPLPLSSHGAVVVARWKQLSEAVAGKARVIKAHRRLELCEGRWVTHQSQGYVCLLLSPLLVNDPPAINKVPGVNLWVHTHTNAITFLWPSQNLLAETSNKILALFLGMWLLQMWCVRRQVSELLIAGGGCSPPYCPICL